MTHLPDLLPGDHLIYTGFDLVDWGIMLKTGSWACHIERYDGKGFSLASRNGTGMGRYKLREKGLAAILRPNQPLDMEAGRRWYYSLHPNQKTYAWAELANFYLPFGSIKVLGMICSTFIATLDQHSGFDVFNAMWNLNKIAPVDFLKSGQFEWIWSRK